MDMPNAKENLEKFKEKLPNVEVYEISAINHQGVDKVLLKLADMLDSIEITPIYEEEKFESHVLYKFKKEQPFEINRDSDGTWVVSGDQVEKLFKMTKFTTDDSIKRFSNKLRKMGIDDKLYELGAKEGDTVRILDYLFELKA